jgi:hypothetical protein
MTDKTPMPDIVWGEFWTPPVDDDVPIPKGVEFDHDTGRYRRALDKAARNAWLQRELSDIRALLKVGQ